MSVLHHPTTAHACTPVLRAESLACRRGGRLLFDKLDLSVVPGQWVWLRGTNGRGKTSLLRMLAGVSRPAHGHIENLLPVVYLGHQDALKGDLTALESLAFLVQLHGKHSACALPGNDNKPLLAALARVGLASRAHLPVRALSQGQRKRVALARLCLTLPGTVWLLDEPLDALDDQGVALVLTLIAEHRAQGGAVVLTSHQTVPGDDLTVFDLGGGA
jgi:heme exporter protein A